MTSIPGLRIVLVALAAVWATACATRPIEAEPAEFSRFSLQPIDSIASSPAGLVDLRAPTAEANDRVVLPDEFFEPPILAVVSRRIGRTAGGRPVEVLEARTELRRVDGFPPLGVPAPLAGNRYGSAIVTGGDGRVIPRATLAANLTLLIAYALKDSMNAAKAAEDAKKPPPEVGAWRETQAKQGTVLPVFVYETYLRVRLDGREYAATGVTQSRGKDHELRARESVDRAIKRLDERIRLE